jgi:PAS domain S-box-containing protein
MGMLNIYILPLIISTVLGLVLTLIIIRNQLPSGARALLILILGCTVWSIGYALEIASADLESKLFWAKFQYFGITTIPLAWYIFSVQHLGSPGWTDRPRKYQALMWVMPVITLCLIWTNEAHHLIWEQVTVLSTGRFTILQLDHGLWFWVYWGFSYLLLLVGTVKLGGSLFTTVRYHRWQVRLMLVGSLIPWIGNFMYVSHLNPVPNIDWTPIAFMVSGALFTISIFRFQMVNILPIARQTVFSEQMDHLLVLDLQDVIVDLNQAAQAWTGGSAAETIGRPLVQVHPELASWVERVGYDDEFRSEITFGNYDGQRFFDLHISPLKSIFRFPIGRLIVLHDISQHKQDQARLEQTREQLEELVDERTETLQITIEQLRALTFRLQDVREAERRQIATELHDGVGQNLTGLNLNLQLIENQLRSIESAEDVNRRLEDSLSLVEATTRQVREVMADLHPPVLDEYGLVAALEWYSVIFAQRTGLRTEVVGDKIQPRLPQSVEIGIFRIVQEALNNVAKYARASQASIVVESGPETVSLLVDDDGIGFEPNAAREPNGEPHWGILNMQQLADAISGKLEIDSAPEQGTRVQVSVRR